MQFSKEVIDHYARIFWRKIELEIWEATRHSPCRGTSTDDSYPRRRIKPGTPQFGFSFGMPPPLKYFA